MKTKHMILAVIGSLFLVSATGQKNEDEPKTKYQLSIIKSENGSKEVIERSFETEEELQDFLKANGEEMELPPIPPVPPVPPIAPEAPAAAEGEEKGLRRTVMIIEKEIINGEGEEISVRVMGDDEGHLVKQLEKEMELNDGADEEVIIVRKGCNGKTVWPENYVEVGPKPANITDLKFFPNPNRGNFHVQFKVSEPANVTLQITDFSGREIYTDTADNFNGLYEKDIYRRELPSGTYLMHVKTAGEKQTLKISVQK